MLSQTQKPHACHTQIWGVVVLVYFPCPNQTCCSLPSNERFCPQLLYVFPEIGGVGWFKACLVTSGLETGKDRDSFLGSDACPGKCLQVPRSISWQKAFASQKWWRQMCHWEGILRNYLPRYESICLHKNSLNAILDAHPGVSLPEQLYWKMIFLSFVSRILRRDSQGCSCWEGFEGWVAQPSAHNGKT